MHTSLAAKAFGIHDIADTMSQHPAGLYRSPALWKLVARASADQTVLVLPQKPSHIFLRRRTELKKIDQMLKSLRKQKGKGVVVSVYVTGRPGYEKTQLVRVLQVTWFPTDQSSGIVSPYHYFNNNWPRLLLTERSRTSFRLFVLVCRSVPWSYIAQ